MKLFRNIVAIILLVILCVAALPAFATESEAEQQGMQAETAPLQMVGAFDPLEKDTFEICAGSRDTIELPEVLLAYLIQEDGSISPDVSEVPVTWSGDYDVGIPDEYTLTAVLPEEMVWAEGLQLPTISVTVLEAPSKAEDKQTTPEEQEIKQEASPASDGQIAEDNSLSVMTLAGFTLQEMFSGTPEIIVAQGTPQEDIPLPEALDAVDEDAREIMVPGIVWESDAYNAALPGDYEFRAVVPDGYALAQEAATPQVIVRVQGMIRTAGMGSKIAEASANLMLSKLEKYLDKREEQGDSAFAGFLGDLIRNNEQDEIHEILGIVQDIERDVELLHAEMTASFAEVMAKLNNMALTPFLQNISRNQSKIDKAWTLYENAILQIEADGGNITDITDPWFDLFFNEIEGMDIPDMLDDLNAQLVLSTGLGDSLYTAAEDAFSSATVFEHQYVGNLVDIYQVLTGMQGQLISLYVELCDRKAAQGQQTNYDVLEGQVAKSIDNQADSLVIDTRSHTDIYENNDASTGVILYADTTNFQLTNKNGAYPAYRVRSNADYTDYVIVNQPFTMNQMAELRYGWAAYGHTTFYKNLLRSTDGLYSLPTSAAGLNGLFDGMTGTYSTWLMENGALKLSSEPSLFLVDKISGANQDSPQQFMLKAYSSTVPLQTTNDDYEIWEFSKIANNNGSYKDPINNKTYSLGDAPVWLIYKSNASNENYIRVNTVEKLKTITHVADGQTLDLTGIQQTDIGLDGHMISMSGNSTIVSNSTLTMNELSLQIGEGANVTLENVNLINSQAAPVTTLGTCGITIRGGCGFIVKSGSESVRQPGLMIQSSGLTLQGDGDLTVSGVGESGLRVPMGTSVSIRELTLVALAKWIVGGVYPPGIGDSEASCGEISIGGGAHVTTDCDWGSRDYIWYTVGRSFKYINIGYKGSTASPGLIENCTLNLRQGGISDPIVIGENVTWEGMVDYRGEIKTMDFPNAGTDTDMFICIVGKDGRRTDDIQINSSIHESNALNKGDTEKFDMYGIDVGEISHIEVYTNGSDDWRGESIWFSTKKDNFTQRTNFALYEWVCSKNGRMLFYAEMPVLKVQLRTASEDNAGSDATIYMKAMYRDGNGNVAYTPEINCKDYIGGNAYRKNTTDTMYINFDQQMSRPGALTAGNFLGISLRIDGNDKWCMKEYYYSLVTPWDGDDVFSGNLVTNQWFNQRGYENKFFIDPARSMQYSLTVKTSSKNNSETDDHILYAIGEEESNMSSFVWSSHNASGNTMKKGSTDAFNVVFDKAIDEIEVLQLKSEGGDKWQPETITIHRIIDGVPLTEDYVFTIDKAFEKKDGVQTYTYSHTESTDGRYVRSSSPAGEVYSAMPVIVTGDQLRTLKSEGGSLSINRIDEYGEVIYSWRIDADNLDGDRLKNLWRLDTTVSRSEDILTDADGGRKDALLNIFDQTGNLPGEITFRVRADLPRGTLIELFSLEDVAVTWNNSVQELSDEQLAKINDLTELLTDDEGDINIPLKQLVNYVLVQKPAE